MKSDAEPVSYFVIFSYMKAEKDTFHYLNYLFKFILRTFTFNKKSDLASIHVEMFGEKIVLQRILYFSLQCVNLLKSI